MDGVAVDSADSLGKKLVSSNETMSIEEMDGDEIKMGSVKFPGDKTGYGNKNVNARGRSNRGCGVNYDLTSDFCFIW